MTTTPVDVVQTTSLTPSRDARLIPYGIVAFAVPAAALAFGQPALFSLAVPFLIALALGLRRTGDVEVTTRMTLFSDRLLEGDLIDGRLELSWDGRFDADALVHRLRGVTTVSGERPSGFAPSADRIALPIRLQATQWGRHSVGEVWLRLTLPFGLVTWTGKVMTGPPVRILPGSERLTELLSPTHSRTAWGMHDSRRIGDGHDFAELRPYVPGDRLRDVNWAATARHGRPIVNRHHPEVSGDVVIALEAFDDGSAASRDVLARAARAAWALASVHMRANDRVGLVGLAGSTLWLPPAGGRLAQYKLMDALLRVGGEAADGVAFTRRWVDVPQSALVIALSTLHDDAAVLTLLRWRSRGRSIAVVMIDPLTALPPSPTRSDRLARRVWKMELAQRVALLRRGGIPVVQAPVDGAISPIVSGLRRMRRIQGAGA